MQTALLMQEAVTLHQQGDLAGAAAIYQQVLSEEPQTADAWHLLGVIAHQVDQHEDAIRNLRKAISLKADAPDFHLNLAVALLSADRAAEAEQSCRRSLELKPDSAPAHNTLGNALRDLGRLAEAVDAFSNALDIEPGYADALCNAGSLLISVGQFDSAEQCLRRALEINPQLFQALTNLGSLYRQRGHLGAASECLVRALELCPQSAETLINLGNTLRESLYPHEAEECFRKALAIRPDSGNAYNSLGRLKQDTGDPVGAVECFRQAQSLNPQSPSIGSNLLYALNLCPDRSRKQTFDDHRRWGSRFTNNDDPSPTQRVIDSSKRLRIGYVSPDFRRHPLVSFFEPMLVDRDRAQFEAICYAEVSCPDEVTSRLSAQADGWRTTCGLSDPQVAELIQADEIDVLVDLAGHTANNRLPVFGLRPTPITLSMLGYLETTGMNCIDGYVTDAYRNPEGDEQYYTETLIRLPGGGCCWHPPEQAPEISEPPVLSNGFVTFGSTHRLDKLTGETLRLWAELLQAVPQSRLLIFRDALGQSGMRQQLTERCRTHGIDPSRIQLAWESENSWLEVYHSIDILLEAIPWGGGTTSFESMWMGVPVPAIAGPSPFSRATPSINSRIGLRHLNAESAAQYESIVTALARDPDELTALRLQFRDRMRRSVCDSHRFMREFEAAVRDLYSQICCGVSSSISPATAGADT